MGHASGRWFHHNLTGLEAEKLLLEKGVNGSFLARPSHSTPGSFTLSVRRGDEVTHIRIQNTEEYLDLYGGEKFATLSELVTYYMENEGQLKEKNGDVIVLKYPLFYEDPTKERWFHGRINGKQAEKMLFAKGTYGGFLVRESVHRPGSYVLSVLTGEQVAHIIIHGRPNGMYDVGGGHQFSSLKELINFYNHTPMVEKNGGLVPLRQPFNTTRFNVSTIDQRIRQLEQENVQDNESPGFSEEFEELHQEAHTKNSTRDMGSLYYNRDKNRYKNILPFDQTQVKLYDGDPNELGSDYINANYICWPVQLTESLAVGNSQIVASMLNLTNSQQSSLGQNTSDISAQTNTWLSDLGISSLQALRSSNTAAAFFFNGKPRYIATQGVISTTQDSFWRMVWQERSCVIVMITKFFERGRNKCVRYWPTQQEGERIFRTYGHILRVRNISERNSTNYTLRELLLSREPITEPSPESGSQTIESTATYGTASDDLGGTDAPAEPGTFLDDAVAHTRPVTTSSFNDSSSDKSLTVYHYHFTVWPDHGTPTDPSCVLDFIHDISARQDSIPNAGPIVAHCSAGIGRTGTFIVIDMLINYIKTMGLNCDIDISRTIQAVREQRSGMVQTETQYRFIYKAVQQYVNTMSKRIKLDNDLRPTGRDYTNINRAADDVGTLASVGLYSSIPQCTVPSSPTAETSSTSRQLQPVSPRVSHSPTDLPPPSSPSPLATHPSPPVRHSPNCPACANIQRKQSTRNQTALGTGTDLCSCAHSPTTITSHTTTTATNIPPPLVRHSSPVVSGLFQRFTCTGRSKARP